MKSNNLPQIAYKNGFTFIGEFTFAPGFRSVAYRRIPVADCSKSIASIIEYVVDHMEQGIPQVPHCEVIRKLGDRREQRAGDDEDFDPITTKRLRDLFKSKGGLHPLWGTLIKSTGGRDAKIYLDLSWKPNTDKNEVRV